MDAFLNVAAPKFKKSPSSPFVLQQLRWRTPPFRHRRKSREPCELQIQHSTVNTSRQELESITSLKRGDRTAASYKRRVPRVGKTPARPVWRM